MTKSPPQFCHTHDFVVATPPGAPPGHFSMPPRGSFQVARRAVSSPWRGLVARSPLKCMARNARWNFPNKIHHAVSMQDSYWCCVRPRPGRARYASYPKWACASRCPPNLPQTQSRLSSPGQTAPSNHRNVLEGDPERALLTLGGGRQPWQRGPRWRFLQGRVKTQQILSERTVNVQ